MTRYKPIFHSVKEEILFCYAKKAKNLKILNNKQEDERQKAVLLFNIFSQFITEMKWTYIPEGGEYVPNEVLKGNCTVPYSANCFDLSKAYISLCHDIGIKNTQEIVYKHKASKKLGVVHPGLASPMRCYDRTAEATFIDDEFLFDQHCVAKVADRFFDLTFSCHYDNEQDIVDNSLKGKIFSALDAKDSKEALEILKLNHQFDLKQTFQGDTLLYRAASSNFADVVAYLLSMKADPNIRSHAAEAPLPLDVVDSMNSPLFKMLAAKTNPIAVQESMNKKQASFFIEAVTTIENNDIKGLFGILDKGLEINYQGEGNWTLLHWAALHNKDDIAAQLLKKRADANIANDENQVPLELTSNNIKSPIFIMLASHTKPSNVKLIRKQKLTILFSEAITMVENNDTKGLASIMAQGLEINHQDEGGWTLLHWAALHNKSDVKTWLIRKGINPNIKNNDGVVAAKIIPIESTNTTAMNIKPRRK